jgi:hypothetical protein
MRKANRNTKLYTGKILAASAAGTSAMTAFSYSVSALQQEEFREPRILSQLIQRLLPKQDKTLSAYEGWMLHYGVGTLFNVVYDQVWRKTGWKPSLRTGLLLGAISGLIGIAVWKTTLKWHPDPPPISFKKYGPHLLVTHLIFGVCSLAAYLNACKISSPLHPKK